MVLLLIGTASCGLALCVHHVMEQTGNVECCETIEPDQGRDFHMERP